jgi:ABC-type uncharacterized transport system ATPase subunit
MTNETKFAIVLTQSQIDYLLDKMEQIAENDEKIDAILHRFDECFELDENGDFIPFVK